MALPFISKRELARAWHILKVAGRYGLAPLVQATGFGRWLGVRFWRRAERRFEALPTPVRLRLALTELGTTFVKLGQILSARSELLPEAYITELSKLQDDVPALPFAEMGPIFLAEFGQAPQVLFRSFDPVPVASASIGQVYQAILLDGSRVMVKIQRPGVHEQVNTDIDLLRRVAAIADKNPVLQRFALPSLVREFNAILQDELLYTLEAHNAEALRREMAGRPGVDFPDVYWPLTSQRVLTTRRVDGVKITDTLDIDRLGLDRTLLARNLANSMLEQILLYGMFHGDPHPGNLLVTADGRIVFLDTGMVGRLDRRTRQLLIELAVGIFDQDIDAVMGTLQMLGVVQPAGDLPVLRQDLSRLITKYYFLPRKELRLGELLQRLNSLLFEHQIRMAYEFGLMAKALFLVEGIAQELDPEFDYNQSARPVINLIRRQYYSVESLVDDTVRELRGLRRQLVELPRRLSDVLDHLERGTLRVRFSDDLWEMSQASSTAAMSRVLFAVLNFGVLALSVAVLIAGTTGWLRYAAYVGAGGSAVMQVFILLTLLRSSRG